MLLHGLRVERYLTGISESKRREVGAEATQLLQPDVPPPQCEQRKGLWTQRNWSVSFIIVLSWRRGSLLSFMKTEGMDIECLNHFVEKIRSFQSQQALCLPPGCISGGEQTTAIDSCLQFPSFFSDKNGRLEGKMPHFQGEFDWVCLLTPKSSHPWLDYGVASSLLQLHSSSLGVKLGLTFYLLLHRKVNTLLFSPLLPSPGHLHPNLSPYHSFFN